MLTRCSPFATILFLALAGSTSGACEPQTATPVAAPLPPSTPAVRSQERVEEDENDPKSWVRRLGDPAQRTEAIKRLEGMFNTEMANAGNKREAPNVKQFLDASVAALATTYLAGGLDERSRRDLIKLLGDMGDPRAARAYAKAFEDFVPGKNDDDVKYAAQGTTRLALESPPVAAPLADALWDCFARFQPSKNNKSINLVKDLQNAVMVVKAPSYGQKAADKLSVPITNPKDPAEGMDQLQFWQATSARLIGELRYTPGIKPLVKVLLTPNKRDLVFPVRLALTKMPREAEPVLIAALEGSDPDLAPLAEKYPEGAYVLYVAEPLARISRPAGRDAILAALGKARNDQNRVVLAADLTHFATSPVSVKAYLAAYAKVPPNAAVPLLGGGNGRAIIAQSAANFFDPTLTEWLLKELAATKGEALDALLPAALQAAIKLMTTSNSKAVGAAVGKIPGQSIESEMFKAASSVLERCKQDPVCFAGVLDTPIPSTPPAAKMGHVKAAWMAAIYGSSATKAALLSKVDSIKDGSVRLATVEAIDHLSPQGDAAAAAALEAIVEADKRAGVNHANDEVYKIALALRARVP